MKTRLEEVNELLCENLDALAREGLTTRQKLLVEERCRLEIERNKIERR